MWIPSHQELGRHPKTRRAARLLETSVPALIGHLHLLWHWCIDFAPNGNLSRWDAESLADAALWDGDATHFMESLIKSGFLDRGEDGALSAHDWDDYAGKVLLERDRNAEKVRRFRGKNTPEETMKEQGKGSEPDDVTVTSPLRNGYVTDREREGEEDVLNTPSPAHAGEDSSSPAGSLLLDAVLAATGKTTDWKMGTISSRARIDTERLVAKLKRDSRTPADVTLYRQKLPLYLGRDPTSVTPPSAAQMLDHFDVIVAFEKVEVRNEKSHGGSGNSSNRGYESATERRARKWQGALDEQSARQQRLSELQHAAGEVGG